MLEHVDESLIQVKLFLVWRATVMVYSVLICSASESKYFWDISYFILSAALTVISQCRVCRMRDITRDSHFSYSLEVFNSPQTNSEDGRDNKSQRDPGEYLPRISLKLSNPFTPKSAKFKTE